MSDIKPWCGDCEHLAACLHCEGASAQTLMRYRQIPADAKKQALQLRKAAKQLLQSSRRAQAVSQETALSVRDRWRIHLTD